MKVNPAEIDNYLKLLEETPRTLAAATKDIDEGRLKSRTAEQPWSVNDILAHLRSCADVWGIALRQCSRHKDQYCLIAIHASGSRKRIISNCRSVNRSRRLLHSGASC